MGTGAEVGHRANISSLGWRQAIKSNTEKALVECCYGSCRRLFDILQCNRTLDRPIPSMFPPFLQEIGIALSSRNDGGHGLRIILRALIPGRLDDCDLRLRLIQRTDHWEVEQPLGIRFCSACHAS